MDEITAKLAYTHFDGYLDICLGWKRGEYDDIYEKKMEIKEMQTNYHIDLEEYIKLDSELFWEYLQRVTG